MKKIFTLTLIIIVIAVAALLLVKNRQSERRDEDQNSAVQIGTLHYVNDEFGIEFDYPVGYRLDERKTGNGERLKMTVTLMREEDYANLENRQNGEGPVSITFDVFQNDVDRLNVAEWIENVGVSNYNLPPDEPYAMTTAGGVVAYMYRWSGLYEGESVVFGHGDAIIMASVSYMAQNDDIRTDFGSIMATLRLKEPAPLSEQSALEYVKSRFTELAGYPSNGLPPKTVSSKRSAGAWNFAFQTEGSGVPYILSAACYSVTDAKIVAKVGDYSRVQGAAEAETLDPSTCRPAQLP